MNLVLTFDILAAFALELNEVTGPGIGVGFGGGVLLMFSQFARSCSLSNLVEIGTI